MQGQQSGPLGSTCGEDSCPGSQGVHPVGDATSSATLPSGSRHTTSCWAGETPETA